MFVDTGAWYAAYVESDPDHDRVKTLIDNADSRLITSDLVLVESLNLFRARGEFQRAVVLGRDLFSGGIAELAEVPLTLMQHAFTIFATYRDKNWSFTDCTSYALMQHLSVRDAIALDEHFRQMQGINVHPFR